VDVAGWDGVVVDVVEVSGMVVVVDDVVDDVSLTVVVVVSVAASPPHAATISAVATIKPPDVIFLIPGSHPRRRAPAPIAAGQPLPYRIAPCHALGAEAMFAPGTLGGGACLPGPDGWLMDGW
jgi:hypothetical protein